MREAIKIVRKRKSAMLSIKDIDKIVRRLEKTREMLNYESADCIIISNVLSSLTDAKSDLTILEHRNRTKI